MFVCRKRRRVFTVLTTLLTRGTRVLRVLRVYAENGTRANNNREDFSSLHVFAIVYVYILAAAPDDRFAISFIRFIPDDGVRGENKRSTFISTYKYIIIIIIIIIAIYVIILVQPSAAIREQWL